MANGKSGRKKKLGEKLATVIILILAVVFVFQFKLTSNENSNQQVSGNVVNQSGSSNVAQDVDGELLLTMIDVGQADSFLFIQEGEVALIDCGTRSTGKDVVKHLKSLGITRIDYIFGTHPHDDHMGGMYDVITNFEIGKIIIPEIESGEVTTNWYMKLMNEINQGNYEVEYTEVGSMYNVGNASMKVIGPISKPNGNLNNYSTVLKVSFGEMDIIMTGDAEEEVEKEIIKSGANLDAEILKVGHHGSDTSNSEEFLDAITPEYALISAKVGNKYEHPTEETMQRLKERDIEVYRTDESGTVVATITTNNVSFDCEPGDYLSGVELEKREGK